MEPVNKYTNNDSLLCLLGENHLNFRALRLIHYDKHFLCISSGDSLTYHRHMPFGTWDHDKTYFHCAKRSSGGWWFNRCHRSNLNAQYGDSDSPTHAVWDSLIGKRSLKSMQMKIRPMNYIYGRGNSVCI